MSDKRSAYQQWISGERGFKRWLLVYIRRYILLLPVVLLVLLALVYVYSWFCSFYNPSVRSLLSAEGVRWSLHNGVRNFTNAPMAKVLLLLISLGLLWRSRLLTMFYRLFHRKSVTLKQRRALGLAFSVLAVYVVFLLVSLAVPHSIMLSVRGTVEGSPFVDGLFMFVILGIALLGTTYGISSGAYRNHVDWIEGAGSLLSRTVSYFITAFIFSELIACSLYTQCDSLMPLCNFFMRYEDWVYYAMLVLFVI